MQRAIWIVTFLIILAGAYYWFVIHEESVVAVQKIADRNELLSDSINVATELERRLELRYIGHGKHLKEIQDEYRAHYESYVAKMDSINSVFTDINFKIEQLEESLTRKINRVQDDLTSLSDSFESYKRTKNRETRDIQSDITGLRDRLSGIDDQLVRIKEKVKLED